MWVYVRGGIRGFAGGVGSLDVPVRLIATWVAVVGKCAHVEVDQRDEILPGSMEAASAAGSAPAAGAGHRARKARTRGGCGDARCSGSAVGLAME